MILHSKLLVYVAGSDEFIHVGTVSTDLVADTLEIGQEESRELVRRNRMCNPDKTMRYRLELYSDGVHVWTHDEHSGDPILLPTEKTTLSCPI